MQFLGSTLASIAGEKSGILKPGVTGVIAPQEPEVQAVIGAQAEKVGAPLYNFDDDWNVQPLDTQSPDASAGYKFLGWYPSLFRRPYMYNYFRKYGEKPENMRGFNLVYFPLHYEPEISLLSVSPEFNNSMELIAWVSKSLPANILLVVKEQPYSYGIRSKNYYDN